MSKPKKTECEYCGDPIKQAKTGPIRKYCTDSCRTMAWILRKAIKNCGRIPFDESKSK